MPVTGHCFLKNHPALLPETSRCSRGKGDKPNDDLRVSYGWKSEVCFNIDLKERVSVNRVVSGLIHLGGPDLVSEIKAWCQYQAQCDAESFRKKGPNLRSLTSCQELCPVPHAGDLSEEQRTSSCNKWSKKC